MDFSSALSKTPVSTTDVRTEEIFLSIGAARRRIEEHYGP
jgi:hypothetical protein